LKIILLNQGSQKSSSRHWFYWPKRSPEIYQVDRFGVFLWMRTSFMEKFCCHGRKICRSIQQIHPSPLKPKCQSSERVYAEWSQRNIKVSTDSSYYCRNNYFSQKVWQPKSEYFRILTVKINYRTFPLYLNLLQQPNGVENSILEIECNEWPCWEIIVWMYCR
jgi:hypothetical protein